MQTHRQTWAIFCKIIDNFGDIGVCWRLAKQLARACHTAQRDQSSALVTLYIDDFDVAKSLIPALTHAARNSAIMCEHVQIMHIDAACHAEVAEIVIETFGCGLPERYLNRMPFKATRWINIDYLSAEQWVSQFHGKPSIHPTLNLTKYYFFPGFQAHTGGLLREPDLIERRNQFDSAPFLDQLSKRVKPGMHRSAYNISLFCYPEADLSGLVHALQSDSRVYNIWLPFNKHLSAFFQGLGLHDYAVGEVMHYRNIRIAVLPFLSQDDYDHLLWACDFNFVRGEDSWIRAIWAAKPFVWQPYRQSENTHLKKLNAFLQTHYPQPSDNPVTIMMHAAHLAWSCATDQLAPPHYDWASLFNVLPSVTRYHQQASQQWSAMPDLVQQLVSFVQNRPIK